MTRRTLVILDEIHHAGDSRSWGDGVKAAFEPAVRRLMLTGTPFRSDENPIPFVALRAGRRRPAAVPLRLHLRVRRRAARRRRPAGDLPGLLGRDPLAHQRRRRAGGPARRADDPGPDRAGLAYRAGPGGRLDAAGAAGRRRPAAGPARARHARRRRPGDRDRPADRPGLREAAATRSPARRPSWCSPTTRAPRAGSPRSAPPTQRWLVAVRMVSEGVDIPRLAVGVYATSASTPLFFAQAIGRFVRVRRPGETASVFLPSVPHLLGLASEMEVQRDHVLGAPKQPDGLRRRPAGAGAARRGRPAASWRSSSRRCPRPPSSTR